MKAKVEGAEYTCTGAFMIDRRILYTHKCAHLSTHILYNICCLCILSLPLPPSPSLSVPLCPSLSLSVSLSVCLFVCLSVSLSLPESLTTSDCVWSTVFEMSLAAIAISHSCSNPSWSDLYEKSTEREWGWRESEKVWRGRENGGEFQCCVCVKPKL